MLSIALHSLWLASQTGVLKQAPSTKSCSQLGIAIGWQDTYHESLFKLSYGDQGTLTLILKGEVSVRLTSLSLLVRTRLFWNWKKCFMQRCSWFLTSEEKEVSRADTSPFRIKVSVPCGDKPWVLARRTLGRARSCTAGTARRPWWPATASGAGSMRWPSPRPPRRSLAGLALTWSQNS